MVKLRKSLSAGYGINAWLQQRITAIIMLFGAVVFFGILLLAGHMVNAELATWQGFFHLIIVKIVAQLVVVAVLIHAWVGMRDIVMDYIKSYGVRILFYTFIVVWLAGSLIYSAYVLWS